MAQDNQEAVKALTTTLSSNAAKNKINAIIGDEKKGARFISTLTSMVTTNPALAECEQGSLVNAALVGFALDLSPQLQQFYVVPFKDNTNHRIVGTFQIGWKGYWQLAMRSGEYAALNVSEVKEGEEVIFDRLAGTVQAKWLPDDVRETKPIIAYVAYFKLRNGFEKTLYWGIDKMKAHAEKYSQGYKSDLKNGTKYTFWSKDFDGMAFKTMLRQIISKYGVMSIEMEKAYTTDMAVVDEKGKPIYVDNPEELKEQIADTANTTPIPEGIAQKPIPEANDAGRAPYTEKPAQEPPAGAKPVKTPAPDKDVKPANPAPTPEDVAKWAETQKMQPADYKPKHLKMPKDKDKEEIVVKIDTDADTDADTGEVADPEATGIKF